MIGIYKITNLINNKVYIGQSIHIERRWQEHKAPSSNSLISKAIRKYGEQNFLFEIIEEVSIEDIECLDDLENFYIHKYNSIVPNGYNVTEYTGVQHTTFTSFSKQDFLDIVDLIQNSDLTFEEIAKKYNLNRRTINRINHGYTHKMANLNYPLRKENIKIKKYNYCIDCGKEIDIRAVRCSNCANKIRRVIERPDRETLKNLIRTNNFVTIGKMFNVSDNAIRKWCIAENLPSKAREIKLYSDEEWALI